MDFKIREAAHENYFQVIKIPSSKVKLCVNYKLMLLLTIVTCLLFNLKF